MKTHYYCTALCGWQGEAAAHKPAQVMTGSEFVCQECGADAVRGSLCSTCHLAPAFRGWDDCLLCGCADLIHTNRNGIDFQRRLLAVHPHELRRFNDELQRQLSALVECGRAVA